jgi:hypothetical protein
MEFGQGDERGWVPQNAPYDTNNWRKFSTGWDWSIITNNTKTDGTLQIPFGGEFGLAGTNAAGIFFPGAGGRGSEIGVLYDFASIGNYWSGSGNGSYGHELDFSESYIRPTNSSDTPRRAGHSIRCILQE